MKQIRNDKFEHGKSNLNQSMSSKTANSNMIKKIELKKI